MNKKFPSNEKELREALRTMTYNSRIYKVVSSELKELGHWKYLPRGSKGNAVFFKKPAEPGK